MDDRNALVGWSDDQWNRIRQAVSEEAHRARVAATFLKAYDLLPPSTQVVPSERFNPTTGEVDDASISPLVEIYEDVVLSGQQVNEEELSSALLAFRQAANAVARVEDQIIFNGQHGYSMSRGGSPERTLELIADKDRPHEYKLRSDASDHPKNVYGRVKVKDGEQDYDYQGDFFKTYLPAKVIVPKTTSTWEILDNFHHERLKVTNPGGLGLLPGAGLEIQNIPRDPGSRDLMVQKFVSAVTLLESRGHGTPFVCVLGSLAFQATHRPERTTMVLPSDQIEPILGSPILRSSAIDPSQARLANDPSQGVLLSLAGDPIDLAVAVDASPQFLNINNQGKYRFRVVERFALRVKDPEAIVRLQFVP